MVLWPPRYHPSRNGLRHGHFDCCCSSTSSFTTMVYGLLSKDFLPFPSLPLLTSLCLSTHPSLHSSINPCIQPTHHFIHSSNQPLHPSITLFIHPSICWWRGPSHLLGNAATGSPKAQQIHSHTLTTANCVQQLVPWPIIASLYPCLQCCNSTAAGLKRASLPVSERNESSSQSETVHGGGHTATFTGTLAWHCSWMFTGVLLWHKVWNTKRALVFDWVPQHGAVLLLWWISLSLSVCVHRGRDPQVYVCVCVDLLQVPSVTELQCYSASVLKATPQDPPMIHD